MSTSLPQSTETAISGNLRLEITELLGRSGIAVYFSYGALLKAMSIALLIDGSSIAENRPLQLLSELASLTFLCLVAFLALVRLKPLRRAEGIEPRVTAMIATFLMVSIALVDSHEPFPGAALVGTCLVAVGSALSVYSLAWLGQSFSIMAEARRLVTGGPYAIVRHPLYVTEAIAVLGIVLLHWSLLAVLAFALQLCLQFRRMRNEEEVLRAAFPEYAAYADRTPRWFPVSFRPRQAA
jgi:protein-S-isoprenylcysteine O-methyltransferase Ste14